MDDLTRKLSRLDWMAFVHRLVKVMPDQNTDGAVSLPTAFTVSCMVICLMVDDPYVAK